MDQHKIAAEILRANRYLTLATCGVDGPWASPIAYTVEPDFTLVFYSARESRHCENMARDLRVAGAIFDSRAASDTADGLQFTAVAHEVADSELPEVMQRYFHASFPDPQVRQRWQRPREDFMGSAPQRFYRIALQQLFKLDPDSQKVDRRLHLNVDFVRSAYQLRDA